MSSCWDNFEEMTYSSANLKRFYFKPQNTYGGIQNYLFYIDQNNGLVFNADSLPFGRPVTKLVPTLEFYTTNGKASLNDTLISKRDTVNFSSPVILKNTSADGKYTRTYTIKVNVHQVDPTKLIVSNQKTNVPADSFLNKSVRLSDGTMRLYFPLASGGFSAYQSDAGLTAWSPLTVSGLVNAMNVASIQLFNGTWYSTDNSGNLYVSGDGLAWTLQPTGVKLVTLFGVVHSTNSLGVNTAFLIGLTDDTNGDIRSVRTADGVAWQEGNPVDADFPVNDYASVFRKGVTNTEFISVMTGLRADGDFSTSAWATEDGLSWIRISHGQKLPIAGKKGAMLFYYEEKLVCYGGVSASGTFSTKMHISKDHGITWINVPGNWNIPALEYGDAYGSVLVDRIEDTVNDKDRVFVWRIGGTSAHQTNTTLWKAFENQAFFIRR